MTKAFDCAERKHVAQERIREELEEASREEEIAYWQAVERRMARGGAAENVAAERTEA